MDAIKKILQRLDTEVNYLFFRRFRFGRIVRRHLQQYYNKELPRPVDQTKTAVYMADGRRLHGGLADRLRGMVSLYSCCREAGVRFKIYFVSPFRLDKYMQPVSYDWRIDDTDMSYNSSDTKVFFTDCRREQGEREELWQHDTLMRYLHKPFVQAHVYTNFFCAEKRFGALFNELFRPTELVEAKLRDLTPTLGENYISISTRFVQLLGDFTEPVGGGVVLDEEHARYVIDLCVTAIETIAQMPENQGKKILVTSDSNRFLATVATIDGVVVIPGEIAHIDVSTGHSGDADLKTFVDFFAIARAERSYLLTGMGLYNSNFSLRAAQAGNHEFIRHKI